MYIYIFFGLYIYIYTIYHSERYVFAVFGCCLLSHLECAEMNKKWIRCDV